MEVSYGDDPPLERITADTAAGDIDNCSHRDIRLRWHHFLERKEKMELVTVFFLGSEHGVGTTGCKHRVPTCP